MFTIILVFVYHVFTTGLLSLYLATKVDRARAKYGGCRSADEGDVVLAIGDLQALNCSHRWDDTAQTSGAS